MRSSGRAAGEDVPVLLLYPDGALPVSLSVPDALDDAFLAPREVVGVPAAAAVEEGVAPLGLRVERKALLGALT